MQRIVIEDSSRKAEQRFQELQTKFSPVKKMTTFFDNENFLITPYRLSNAHIHTVMENTNGDLLEFSSLNCGYGGEGPGATARVMRMLGVDKTEAEMLRTYDGLQISFQNNEYTVETRTFFNGSVRQKERDGLNINQYCVCNVITRDVYLINPETHNIAGLIDCLHVMNPEEIELVCGKKASLIDFHGVPDLQVPNRCAYPDNINGVNLVIRGKFFDVNCFVDSGLLLGTVNTLYLYLMKRPLFEEKNIGRLTIIDEAKNQSFLREFQLAFDLIRKQREPMHMVLNVSDKELKRNV